MRYFLLSSLAASAIVSLASGQAGSKSKKPQPPAILASAQYIFVEPYSSTDTPEATLDTHASAEDRQAVADVENAIIQWQHFKLANRRSEADLVILLRKGRIASANAGVHVHVGTGGTTSRDPSQTDGPAVTGLAGAEVGPNQDIFWVYSLAPDGKLTGPIWQKSLMEGLDTPQIVLFEKFKDDVAASIALQAKNQTSARKKTTP
jgi:hypothetical protein